MEQLYERLNAEAWDTAFSRCQAARAAEDAYDQAAWRPAFDRFRACGERIPPEVDAEIECLQDVRCDAEDELALTPAPDLPAVIAKIEMSRKRWDSFSSWPDIWWDAVMCDLRSLGEAI